MTVKAGESSGGARKRQVTEKLAGLRWMAISFAFGGLLVAVACLAFWLGQTIG